MFRLFATLGVLLISSGQVAFAADVVDVRFKEHEGYSRLVFDFGKTVKYSLDKTTSGKLILGFEQQADVAGELPNKDALRNISGVKVLSDSPLKLSINVPADSRIRDFSIGDRLILDVYNSPGQVQPAREDSDAPQAVQKSVPEPAVKPKKVEAATATALSDEKKEEPAVVPAKAEEAQAHPEEHKEVRLPQPDIPIKIQKPQDVNHNLVALSDTKAFGMAVFELNGKYVFVNDSATFSVIPQFNGPQASVLNPAERLTIDGATAFEVKQLEGFDVLPTGGGLLWRIAISDVEKVRKPVALERLDVVPDRLRSGSLFWPLDKPRKLFEMEDPYTGRMIKIVTVDDANQFTGSAYDFVDLMVLPSAVGLAILPKVDDLEIELGEGGVTVSRPEGLTLASSEMRAIRSVKQKVKRVESGWKNIYHFHDWMFGDVEMLNENRNIILSGFDGERDQSAPEGFLDLAKMYLSNAMGFEALGLLDLVADKVEGISDNHEFKALRAGSEALSGRYQEAFYNLSDEDLSLYPETGYWKAFVLANLGDWQQAIDTMPREFDVLFAYPDWVFNRLAVNLAEIALRAGEVDTAQDLLDEIEHREEHLLPHQKAALAYLQGESSRQQEEYNTTIKTWNKLAAGSDDLYRARAGLALTRLSVERGKISSEDEINNLERLRYAWRGDELEAQVNYWLGKAYFETGEYARALNILREATTYAVGSDLSSRIAAEMRDLYVDLFLGERLSKMSPLDAAALYEQFSELVPSGDQGDQIVERLAERLVQADLLDRASALLEKQLSYRLKGVDAYRVARRLALLKLIDEQPGAALEFLDRAEKEFKALPEESQTEERELELSLLRARAFAFRGRADQAIAMLEALDANSEVHRMMADIAWSAGFWDDAAAALDQVMIDEDISMTRPLTPDHAVLVLNRAVALNLAQDRIALANMREKYTDLMSSTDKGKIFEVVTRPRQRVSLADRETLTSIVAETDLFADFLSDYGDYKNATGIPGEDVVAEEPVEPAQ